MKAKNQPKAYMINSIVRIRALYKRRADVAQETGDRATFLLEVSLLGTRFCRHKNAYHQDYQTPEVAKHLYLLKNSVVEVTT